MDPIKTKAGFWRRQAWLPVPVLLVSVLVLWAMGPKRSYESSSLLLGLNLVFSTLASLAVAVLAARGFLRRPTLGLLSLGSGVLIWGLGSFAAPPLGGRDPNILVTIHNLCVFLAACGYLVAVVLMHQPPRSMARARWWVAGAYAGALALVIMVAQAAVAGWLPVFFVDGQGGTRARQGILASTISLLVLTAALLRPVKGRAWSAFNYWYALALLLLAVGLLGVILQPVTGSLIGWTGRVAQYLGGAYMIAAVVASIRETGAWQVRLDTAQWDDLLVRLLTPQHLWSLPATWRYGLAIVITAAATALRWALVPWLGATALYNVALPAVAIIAVLFGLGPGLLSLLMAAVALELLVLPAAPITEGAAMLVRLDVTVVVGVLLCWVLHAVRAAQIKAQRNEARLAAFAAATFEGIVESRAGRIVDCNQQFAQMLGRTAAELKGLAIADLVAPEDREWVMAHIRANRESVTEHSVLRKDGTRRIVEAHGKAATEGGLRYTAIRDISERKQAEAELERARNTLAEAQKIAHLGSFEYVAAARTTVWSEEEYRIYGLDPAGPSPAYEVMLARCIHPDDAALLHATFTKAMQSGAIYELEHRIVRPDGSVRWVYDRALPHFDENRNLVRYVGATLDITERKEAEAALRNEQARLSTILENLPVGVWIVDASGRVISKK